VKIKINDISIFKMGVGSCPSPGIFGKQFLKLHVYPINS